MIAIPLALLLIGLFLAVVSGLAWSGQLPGNSVVGIRAPEARKSQENWVITHRVAGPSWSVASLAFIGAGALAFQAISPANSSWLWLWVGVAVLAGVVMIGVGAAMGSHTIALYEAKKEAAAEEADSGCSGSCGSCTGGLCGSAPEVDRDALRRAANEKDA